MDFHMDAAEFEGFLYTNLSEQLFKNQKMNIKSEKYDFTISDYVSQNFGMLVEKKMTCLSCH